MADETSKEKTRYGVVGFVLTCGALALSALPAVKGLAVGRPWVWLAVMSFVFLAFLAISRATTRHSRGLWVDDRYKMNLSRVQVTLWTLVIISAYLTAAMSNAIVPDPDAAKKSEEITRAKIALKAAEQNESVRIQEAVRLNTTDANKKAEEGKGLTATARKALNELENFKPKGPLEVAMPPAVWALLGISVTTFLGSPLILDAKKSQEISQTEVDNAKAEMSKQGFTRVDQVGNQGKVLVNTDYTQAAFSDLFRGEETGNVGTIDLGKVQLFYFTIVVLFVYAAGLFVRFASEGPVHDFPGLDTSIVALMGISNVGYLANKAVPHGEPPKQP